MKWHIAMALGAGASLFALQGEARQDPQDDLPSRIELLEKEVQLSKARIEELTSELGSTRALVDQTVTFLQAQSKSASAMASTLDESEELGFTAGINFTSREVLLAGWREQLKQQQTSVPGAKKAPEAAGEKGQMGRPGVRPKPIGDGQR